ncbi:MAG: cytochrome c, partial [Deltaproteobacteria bacterium]
VKKALFLAGVLFSIVVVAVLVLRHIDDYADFWRMRETPGVRPYEEPLLIMAEGVVPVSASEAMLRASKGDDLKSPLNLQDPAAIEAGKKLYFNFCFMCHGPNHDGKGSVGQSFSPLPADLRSAKVQAFPEGVHFKEISYGVPDGRQPALATTIPVLDRWRIVAYVKSIGVRK